LSLVRKSSCPDKRTNGVEPSDAFLAGIEHYARGTTNEDYWI